MPSELSEGGIAETAGLKLDPIRKLRRETTDKEANPPYREHLASLSHLLVA